MHKQNYLSFFHTNSKKGPVFDIALTGMMLALVIIFQYLEQYMSWLSSESLKINISLLFILITWLISGFPWAILLLLIRFIITPAFSSFQYSEIGWYSSFLLLFLEVLFILLFICTYSLLKKKIVNANILLITSLVLTLIISVVLFTFLNGVFITPLFWKLLFPTEKIPWFPKIVYYYKTHSNFYIGLLGIKNYWAGIWILFGTGNLFKFTIIILLIFPLVKLLRYLT